MANINAAPPGFAIANNTAAKEVKANPKDRIQIEVGDSKQPDFKPQYKFMRWDNEVNFSIRAEEHPSATVETQGNVIKYIRPDYEVHMYEKPQASEDGGFEFEWILPSIPASNVLSTTIETKGLNFFYQPALTQQEIDDGASRPDNVVGSYAVYHATKGRMNRSDGMEYKVGKAFHIYRPKAIDNNGVEEWCDLNINEQTGVLTVTVPQTFLDNATYPVTVDPTFGYTTIGSSSRGYNNNDAYGSLGNPGETGTVDKITAYVDSHAANIDLKAVVFNSSGNVITNGVGGTVTLTGNGWFDMTYSTSPSIDNNNYYSSAIGGNSAGPGHNAKYDTDTSNGLLDFTNSFASPANIGTNDGPNEKYSIYATYTASSSRRIFNIS